MKHRNIRYGRTTSALLLALALSCLTCLTAQAGGRGTHGHPIVGLWQVVYHGDFEGVEAFNQWHADGLEWESSNEGLGVLCQGVWEPSGRFGVRQYHTWWAFDPDTGQLNGVYKENQRLTVSQDGQSYAGTFLVRSYDLNGNRTGEFRGTVNATRLTVQRIP
jgi:hypothetical protein